jgi:CheY-like chemotaxis protein
MRESNLRLQQALTELQRAQQRIVEQERLRALGQMAGGIFHDFNNALAQVVGYAELLLTRPADLKDHDRSREYLGYILIAARDATAVVERLREFYRAREPGEAHRPIDLNPLVEAVVALTRPRWKDKAQARGAEMRVKTKLAASARVLGDESELREALTNLVFNALDAMPAGGAITIATRDAGNRVVVEVRDTGAGMPPPVRRRCLEPFFTTKGNRGTGLGLSMVHGIMRRHGGEVEVRSAAGRGTTVRLRVPAAARAAPEVGSAPIRLRPGRALSVLVVDDEPRLRDLISRYLAIDGHRVSAAADGARALEQFRAGRFDVLLTDRCMPGMTGDQLAAAVKELAPNTPVIMLTGFGDLMAVGDDRPTGVDRLLSKPLKLGALRQALKDAVAREPGQLAERREERCE